ncbi:VOC family protein [Niveispirillum sp.]|uniref:VOC family protein n=1 Tax=Niveispirillum sp. TaxID=1917217 RepID=UPI001B5520A6|nr:VOC family protein [Niveispirillum sp.]MBP7334837.1 VOC family protein [Niveispirillum sp.]
MIHQHDNAVGALGYLGFGVASQAAWTDHAALLGLMSAAAGPDGSTRYRIDEHAWRFALHDDPTDDFLYAGFECGSAEHFDAVVRRIQDAGITIERDAALAATRGVMELARCVDPDGLAIELYYGPRLVPEVPFRSPQPLTGFVTGDQGLGHIIVNTSDVAASTAFYTSVLGMRLSDRILFEAAPGIVIPLTFLHCNDRHHSIAIAPAMPGGKRIHHVMLEVPGIDDVGLAIDRFMKAGTEITATLGRHSNDRMLSFYVRTPSGFEVEYGCEGIAVGGPDWSVGTHAAISVWGHHRARI